MNTTITSSNKSSVPSADLFSGSKIRRVKTQIVLLVLFLLTVSVARSAEVQPGRIRGEQTIEAGAVPALIQNDLLPYSPTGTPYAFQWEYAEKDNLSLGWIIAFGATSESYRPGALGKSTYYRRAVVYQDGPTQKKAYSNQVLVTVNAVQMTPGSIGANQTVGRQTRPATLVSIAPPQNSGGSYTLLWQSSPSASGPWTAIAGATGLAYSPPQLQATTYFRRGASRSTGQTVYSNIVCVSVIQPLCDASYVLEYEPLAETDNPLSLPANACRRTARYVDGLGRAEQTVRIGASPSGADLVQMTDYDDCGRVDKTWLAVPVASNAGKRVAPAALRSAAVACYADQAPYASTVYESSPLGRPLAQYGPGDAWRTADRAVRTRTLVNAASGVLACARFVCGSSRGDTPQIVRQGDYPPGELLVTETADEDGRLSYTFRDKSGQTILTRRMNGAQALDTYCVYDRFGLLRVVFPPKASAVASAVHATVNLQAEVLQELVFMYRYDSRGRMVGSKRPGAAEALCIYDDSDFPVFTQDGVQRASGLWSYSIPDSLGRVALRGTCASFGGKAVAQGMLDGKTLAARFDGGSANLGYSVLLDGASVNISGGQFLGVEYYDGYDFLSAADPISRLQLAYDGSRESEGYGRRYEGSCKGLRTGRVTGTLSLPVEMKPQFYAAYYYDMRGRPVQSVARNHLSGLSRTALAYDFAGNPVKTREAHTVAASLDIPEKVLVVSRAFDQDGRVKTLDATLDGVDIPNRTVYGYDALGRLSSKVFGAACDLTYSCNIRGWLDRIVGSPFSMILRYNTSEYGATPLYSGMVCEWQWQHDGALPDNVYAFTYDGAGRLAAARQTEDGARTDRFTERGIAYDPNGNLLTLSRTAGAAVADSLAFTFAGNRLTALSGTSSATFEYDANGNLTKDGLNSLQFNYNCLDLVQEVETTGGQLKASFTHGSDGEKLSAKSGNNGFEYLGSLIYVRRNGKLSFEQVLFDEGAVKSSGPEYWLRDHLGSVRVIVNKAGKILEQNDYYPFGGRHGNSSLAISSTNRYKFSGKESLEPFDIGLLDFGARFYDARLARWTTQDPMAENYLSLSPYNHCAGNPISFVDPTGMKIDEASLKNWETLKAEMQQVQSNLENRLARMIEKGGKQNRIANLQERVSGMRTNMTTMSTIESSSQLYALNTIAPTETGSVTYDPESQLITLNYANSANFVHELTHAGQFETGDVAFDPELGGAIAQDIYDEIAAYKAQYAFDPYSVSGLVSGSIINSMADITVPWLQSISDAQGKLIYSEGGLSKTSVTPLNINSPKTDVLKAYPSLGPFIKGFSNTDPLKKMIKIHYKR